MYNLPNNQINKFSNNYYRQQRKQERYERRVERRKQKSLNNAEKKRLWKLKKRELYDLAHSLDFYEEADLHLTNRLELRKFQEVHR